MNRMLLVEALDELRRRKLRTLLTLLGMIFGVGAIVAMLAVGEGSRREALRLVGELGLDNLIVESRALEPDELRDIRTRSIGLGRADAEAALKVVPGAESVAMARPIRVFQIVAGPRVVEGEAWAVSGAYREHGSLAIGAGRWFDDADAATAAPVAVIGQRLARTLFDDADPVGRRVRVNHVWLEIVGVLAARDIERREFEGVRLGLDEERLFVPWETGRTRFRLAPMEPEVARLSVKLASGQDPEPAATVLGQLLDARHGGTGETTLIVPAGLYRQQQQTQRIFTVVMASIAGVSLLVGGIGIMNIMLANVLERRREIGLKRALGARRRDVVEQFLAEALVISVLGGLIGLAFGAVLALAIGFLAGWSVAWSPWVLIPALLVCGVVGVGFGVYPARRAAELDPIAALRTDG